MSDLQKITDWINSFGYSCSCKGVESLTILDLSNKQITEIPSEMGRLKELRHLYLNGNQIVKIPSEIKNLKKLIALYLNTKGESRLKTLQMLKDANFTIESDKELDELINSENNILKENADNKSPNKLVLKNNDDLRSQKI